MAELYRHFDARGKLLYVGISVSTMLRLAAHKNTSAWFSEIATVKVEHFRTRGAAEKAEVMAIRKERPKYNLIYAVKPSPPAGRRTVQQPVPPRAQAGDVIAVPAQTAYARGWREWAEENHIDVNFTRESIAAGKLKVRMLGPKKMLVLPADGATFLRSLPENFRKTKQVAEA